MKQKDIIMVVIVVIILAIAGILVATQLLPQNSSSSSASSQSNGTVVDVIGPINPSLDQDAIKQIQDPTKSSDYTVTIDLSTGLGNPILFGR